jgi:hypothetical protein
MVLAEALLKASLQVVVMGLVGVWLSLHSSADGQHEDLPIVIIGDHGDLSLESGTGEQTRYMTDFAEQRYHKNRQLVHLALDQADAFAPQCPRKEQ